MLTHPCPFIFNFCDWFHPSREIPDYVIISYDYNRGIPSFYFYTRNFKKKFLRYKYIFSFSGVGPCGWYRHADSRPDDRFSSIFNLFGGPTSWGPGILGTTSPYAGVLPSPARLLLILLSANNFKYSFPSSRTDTLIYSISEWAIKAIPNDTNGLLSHPHSKVFWVNESVKWIRQTTLRHYSYYSTFIYRQYNHNNIIDLVSSHFPLTSEKYCYIAIVTIQL